MFRGGKKKRPDISAPLNFEHRVHTGIDPSTGTFVGLPKQWKNLIVGSNEKGRPKPIVDPSYITNVEIMDLKV